MRNLFLLFLICFLSSSLIRAQTEEKSGRSKFNVHAEASSSIFTHSVFINLEGKVYSFGSETYHLYARAAYGHVNESNSFFCDRGSSSGGLLGATMLAGKKEHIFEASGGVYLASFESKVDVSPTSFCDVSNVKTFPLFQLGYRYQKPKGGILFNAKVGSTGIGIGLGFAF